MEVEQTSRELEKWISSVELTWRKIPEFKVPEDFKHLAVICDGNRRSAKEKGLHPWEGHRLGIEVIKGIMKAGKEWGIEYLTFWTWSTENWKRESDQIEFVMGLAAKFLRNEEAVKPIFENEIHFRQIGRLDRIPGSVRSAIMDLEDRTSGFDKFYVNLALDYGGMDEIARATARIIEDGKSPEEVAQKPELIFDYLDTAGQPLPDLVIRTGQELGEVPHTSGFMPLQTAYSGWKFIPDLFPDLTPDSLVSAVSDLVQYERRMGR